MYAKSTAGQAAYELDRLRGVPEIPYGDSPRQSPWESERRRQAQRERTGVRTRERTRAKTRAKRQSVSVLAVIGFLCVGFMSLMVVTSYIKLAALSDEIVKLESEALALGEEAGALQLEYESEINMAEIEAYARNVLGMNEPTSGQVYYIDSSMEDQVVIPHNAGEEKVDIWSEISGFINSLLK